MGLRRFWFDVRREQRRCGCCEHGVDIRFGWRMLRLRLDEFDLGVARGFHLELGADGALGLKLGADGALGLQLDADGALGLERYLADFFDDDYLVLEEHALFERYFRN